MVKQINENLSDDQKRVLFEKGTETPGTGKFLNHNKDGTYTCANCDSKLFTSDSKYDSKMPGLIGWPSFDSAIEGAVNFIPDSTLGMERTEVICSNCGAHLGHVFDADDAPSGKHYCINSVCLGFNQKD